MVYAYQYDVPGTADLYRQVMTQVGDVRPEGLVVHLVVAHEGGLRHVGVWESRRQWEDFRDGHVRPAVDKVLTAAGFASPPPPPVEEEIEVVDVMTVAPGG